jgi:hypothetical protein
MGIQSRPQDRVAPGQILGLLAEVLVARLNSKEEIDRFSKSLTRTSGGWWQDSPRQYEKLLAQIADTRAALKKELHHALTSRAGTDA